MPRLLYLDYTVRWGRACTSVMHKSHDITSTQDFHHFFHQGSSMFLAPHCYSHVQFWLQDKSAILTSRRQLLETERDKLSQLEEALRAGDQQVREATAQEQAVKGKVDQHIKDVRM